MMQSLSAHLPALQVIVPLLAAPLCFLLRKPSLAWLFTFVVTVATFAISIGLFSQITGGDAIAYKMGGWEPPWGIEYRIDRLSSLVLLLVSGMAAVTMAYARSSVEREISSGNQVLFRESLERARHWVAQFFESDEAAARAMDREIAQLADASVAADMPDISRSLRALDEVMEQRLQQGGVE